MALEQQHEIHFTGTTPKTSRLSMINAQPGDVIEVAIHYQEASRLQVYVDDVFVEDMNWYDGRYKGDLVRAGRWAPNDGAGGWTDLAVDMTDSSQPHGANAYFRGGGLTGRWPPKMLHVLLRNKRSVTIKTMPVVRASMGVQMSVDQFYQVRDAFIENLAGSLGIPADRITIVAGNARRRRALLTSSATVEFEISPTAQLSFAVTSVSVLDNSGVVSLTVERTSNIYGTVSVDYTTTGASAIAGTHFTAASGTLEFGSQNVSKTINITIIEDTAWSEDRTFTVVLSNPTDANVVNDTVTITVQNIYPPAPSTPTLGASSSSSVSATWSVTAWTAPSSDYDVSGHQLAFKTYNDTTSEWSAWTIMAEAETPEDTVTFLATYQQVVAKARTLNAAGASEWSGESSAARSSPVCGDGVQHGVEECDLGGGVVGCSSTCTVEDGYACNATHCETGCGDGTTAGNEGCDDSNTVSGDGCSGGCSVETGFACSGSPSSCSATCGDSVKASSEACDDGNTADGDGCSSSCTVETGGWTCSAVSGVASVCQNCGNSLREGTEVCDNGGGAGCESCSAVTAGWKCVGGSNTTADTCTAGPDVPATVTSLTKAADSITWSWITPADNGADVVAYWLQYRAAENSTWIDAATFNLTGTSFKTLKLQATTAYVARVKAANAAGWSEYSAVDNANNVTTLAASVASASSELTELSENVGSATAVASEAANVTVENMELTVPPADPEEADPAAEGDLVDPDEFADLTSGNDTVVINGTAPDNTTDTTDTQEETQVLGAGVFQLPVDTIVVEEGQTATVNISRVNGTFGAVTVTVSTQDGTASAGVDYTALSQTVSFAAGEETKQVSITTTDTGIVDYTRLLSVVLSAPSGTSKLDASRSLVAVSISDNEVPPTVSVATQSGLTSFEEGSDVTVVVKRDSIDTALGFTVRLQTVDGTAVAGTDYVAIDKVVSVPPGVASVFVDLALLLDGVVDETDETLTLQLSQPNKASLGTTPTLTITITPSSITAATTVATTATSTVASTVATTPATTVGDTTVGDTTVGGTTGSVQLSAQITLSGMSAAEFTSARQTSFIATLADICGVGTNAVTIVSSADVTVRATALQIDATVATASSSAATAAASALETTAGNGTLSSQLEAAGFPATTATVVTTVAETAATTATSVASTSAAAAATSAAATVATAASTLATTVATEATTLATTEATTPTTTTVYVAPTTPAVPAAGNVFVRSTLTLHGVTQSTFNPNAFANGIASHLGVSASTVTVEGVTGSTRRAATAVDVQYRIEVPEADGDTHATKLQDEANIAASLRASGVSVDSVAVSVVPTVVTRPSAGPPSGTIGGDSGGMSQNTVLVIALIAPLGFLLVVVGVGLAIRRWRRNREVLPYATGLSSYYPGYAAASGPVSSSEARQLKFHVPTTISSTGSPPVSHSALSPIGLGHSSAQGGQVEFPSPGPAHPRMSGFSQPDTPPRSEASPNPLLSQDQ
eukprot:CAMPEP_0175820880 /NCGR_PEP_ID=MMETSP0107_2-20121207/8838_1 /TAXON_ID=195067 ORGANISM="Goniomonas pacifica, Strain CCMP1869" /NCGR_SAMPLE_ID=MMETSP0107_2 /ASSEMBLY_ACC=CAM_ASM_000203 /LENGTH=1487 /DNA_ID=CAMNT_0017133223 /DNA_START=27 /DNA_END=4490 /DNA_ORIENTATION=+